MRIDRVVFVQGLVWLLICGAATSQETRTPAWSLHNRAQVDFSHDNNVEESLRNPQAAQSLRLMTHFKATRRTLKWNLGASYQGGLQFYPNFALENKLINELHCSISRELISGVKAGVQIFGRLKLFLNRETDYLFGHLTPFIQVQLPRQSSFQVSFRNETLDYGGTNFYDYKSPGFHLQINKTLFTRFTLSPQFSYGKYFLDRPAYDVHPFWETWRTTSDKQTDQSHSYGLSLDGWLAGALVNVNFRFEKYQSNSYGYSFRRQALTVVFAKEWHEILVRGYSSLQIKSYLDNLLPISPITLDTEQEENNFVILDVSREFAGSFVGLLRAGWYKNESPWANLYYEKWLFNLGVEYRFTND